MCFFRWTRQVSNHALFIILATLSISFALFLFAIFSHPLPSFTEPLLGFEPRKTDLSNRINTWNLLRSSTSLNSHLSIYTSSIVNRSKINSTRNSFDENEEKEEFDETHDEFNSKSHFDVSSNKSNCGDLVEDYVQVVVESRNKFNLFTLSSLQAICHIDSHILRKDSNNVFEQSCERTNLGNCCPSWSLPNYVAFFSNKSSCLDIVEGDVENFKRFIENCAPYYFTNELNTNCQKSSESCAKAPSSCYNYDNAIYTSLHFLVNHDFFSSDQSKSLKVSSIFLPLARSTKLIEYYSDLLSKSLIFDDVKVVALSLGDIKQSFFEKHLIQDGIYVFSALFFVFFILWLYTSSFIITIVTILTICSAFEIAYFFYVMVYGMPFFPFINILSVIILIGKSILFTLHDFCQFLSI